MDKQYTNLVYTPLAPDLYLVRQTIPSIKKDVVAVPEPVNHVWIYDRSGSMTHLLPGLALDLINHVMTLKDGDTLTLGWFSSEGKWNFMLKGMTVHENLDNIKRLILANDTPIALTCFSEILHETATSVISDLLAGFGSRISLMFFTDGYPVVSNYTREIDAIMRACRTMNASLTNAILVGYGEYYNRQVLGDMAQAMGAVVLHSSELPDFTEGMKSFIQNGVVSEPKQNVKMFPYNRIVTFTNQNGNVGIYDPLASDLMIPENIGEIWSVQTDMPVSGQKVGPKEIESGLYAAASACVGAMRPDISLLAVGKLGDVALVDAINNAWTNEEFGRASKALAYASTHEEGRYTEGRNLKYVPRPDAFCVMDAIDTLIADEGARFAPKSDLFKYNRIGVATKTKDGYPEFHSSKDVLSPIDLTWNKSRLNLSVLSRIPGTVDLGEDAPKYGFSRIYPTFVWRNYTVIKDGVLNTKTIPVAMSQGTFAIFQANKMIDKNVKWEAGKVYAVNLTKAPLVNRAISDTKLYASTFVQNLASELELMARVKVYKYFYEHYYPKAERQDLGALTKEQADFLEGKGITSKGYAPPVESLPATDHYIAKDFSVAIKGFSSLPAVEKTLQKGIDGGKLTPSEELIWKSYQHFASDSKMMFGDKTPARGEGWFEVAIREINNTLRGIRKELLRDRFVILAGKRWFADLTDRDGAIVKYGNYEFTFNIKDVEVDY